MSAVIGQSDYFGFGFRAQMNDMPKFCRKAGIQQTNPLGTRSDKESLRERFLYDLKIITCKHTKTTNELERSNLIDLAKGGKCARFLVGLANMYTGRKQSERIAS